MWLGRNVAAPRTSLRFRLLCAALAAVAGVGLAVSYLIYAAWQEKRENLSQNMLTATRTLSMTMDRELGRIKGTLQALATSRSIDAGDYSCFHAQALAVLASHPGADIILADSTGQQLVNSFLPPGAPLPKRNLQERVGQIFRTGEPSISGVFHGAVTGRHLVSIDVPVQRDGRVLYELGMTLPADNLITALDLPNLPAGWAATILDSANVIVGRTGGQQDFIDKPFDAVLPGLARQMREAPEGLVSGVGLSGAPILAGYSLSPGSGWTMVVSVPEAVLLRELRLWLSWALGGTALLAVLGLGAVLRLGNRVSRSAGALMASARALGRGESVSAGSQDFIETQEVAEALAEASRLLRQREAELEEEREKGLATLRRSEALYRSVVEDQTEIIGRLAEDGTFLYVNDVYCRFFGLGRDELLGTKWQPRAHPEDVAMVEERLRTLSPENPVVISENRVHNPEGEVRWMQFVNRGIFDGDGSLTEIQYVGRDVTERRNLEEALRASEQSAERRAAWLDAALGAIAEGLIVLDADGKVLRVNQAARQAFPFLEEGTVIPGDRWGVPVAVTDADGAPQRPQDIPGFRALRGETVVGEVMSFTFPDGAAFWATVNAAPIRGQGGAVLGSVVTFQDITERKKAEQFRQDVERIIRHDIKSPLIGLHSLAECVLEQGMEEGEFRSEAPRMLHAIRQVLKLVDSSEKILLMERGIYAPCARWFEFDGLVGNVELSLSPLLNARKVRLRRAWAAAAGSGSPLVYGEEFLVEDMILNLVKNAVEASPENAEVTINCTAGPEGRHIGIHNPGEVPGPMRERFFMKYATDGKPHGKGLGTYSAKLVARAHGGSIGFVSTAEEGTTVSVILPGPPKP